MQSSTLSLFMATALLVILNLDKGDCRMTLVQIKNALKGPGKSCMKKSGVSKATLEAPYNGQMPHDPALGCFYQCIFTAMKGTTKAGVVDYDLAMKQMKTLLPLDMVDKSVEIAETCFAKLTTDEICERAWQLVACSYEIDPSTYMFPNGS